MQHLTEQTVVYSAKSDTEKSFDCILPEYLPGISRIIKTYTSVNECVFSANMAQPSNNLSLKLGIIYISEYDGKIKSASFTQEFSCEFKEAFVHTGEYTAVPSCFVVFCQAIPQSPRKFTARIALQTSVTVYSESKTQLFFPDEENSMCIVTDKFCACTKKIIPETHFEKNEEISLDNAKNGIREIIHTNTNFSGISAKASDSEINFDASINLRILYENANDDEDKDAEYSCLDTVITLSDTLHCENIRKDDMPFIYVDVYSVEPSVSLDPYGENRVLSLVVKYTLSGFAYRRDDFDAVTDAFIEGYTKDPDFEEISVESIHSEISKKEHVSHSPHADIREITEVSACNTKIQSVSIEHSEGQFFASARCLAEVLGTNLSGELSGLDVPLLLRIPLGGKEVISTDTIPDVLINIQSCSAQIKEGALKMEFDIGINGVFVTRTKRNVVSAVETDDSFKINKRIGEIVVYYPSKNEVLWDIAKKYRINPKEICLANGEDENSIHNRSAIIIP